MGAKPDGPPRLGPVPKTSASGEHREQSFGLDFGLPRGCCEVGAKHQLVPGSAVRAWIRGLRARMALLCSNTAPEAALEDARISDGTTSSSEVQSSSRLRQRTKASRSSAMASERARAARLARGIGTMLTNERTSGAVLYPVEAS